MVRRIFLYFLREKREGLAFERLKFVSSTTGTSATGSAFNFVECFVTNNRRGGLDAYSNGSCLRWRAQLDGGLKL